MNFPEALSKIHEFLNKQHDFAEALSKIHEFLDKIHEFSRAVLFKSVFFCDPLLLPIGILAAC